MYASHQLSNHILLYLLQILFNVLLEFFTKFIPLYFPKHALDLAFIIHVLILLQHMHLALNNKPYDLVCF